MVRDCTTCFWGKHMNTLSCGSCHKILTNTFDNWAPDAEVFWKEKPMEDNQTKTDKMEALDVQVGGKHYKNFKIQPIEYIHANELGYCEANIVKYISRWRDKGGKQDLEKVKHYVDLLIQLERL